MHTHIHASGCVSYFKNLFIHRRTSYWFHDLSGVNSATVNWVCMNLQWIWLFMCSGRVWLDRVVVLLLVFEKLSCWFPWTALHCCQQCIRVWGFPFYCSSETADACFFFFLMKVFATKMKENFSVILIHVSLMAKDVIYFPSIPIGYLHFKIVQFNCPLSTRLFDLLMLLRPLYSLDINPPWLNTQKIYFLIL